MGGPGSGRKKSDIETIMANGGYRPSRFGTREPEKRGTGTAPLQKDPPEYLDCYGVAVWRQLFPEVTTGGLVTEAERELFALYCQAAGRARQAAENMPEGPIVDLPRPTARNPGKTVKGRSPWYEVLRDATTDVARLGSQLGLTSIDRSRVLKAKSAAPTHQQQARPKSLLDMGGPLKIAQGSFEE